MGFLKVDSSSLKHILQYSYGAGKAIHLHCGGAGYCGKCLRKNVWRHHNITEDGNLLEECRNFSAYPSAFWLCLLLIYLINVAKQNTPKQIQPKRWNIHQPRVASFPKSDITRAVQSSTECYTYGYCHSEMSPVGFHQSIIGTIELLKQ